MSINSSGGINEVIRNPPKQVKCSACLQVLSEPESFTGGHVFCKNCLSSRSRDLGDLCDVANGTEAQSSPRSVDETAKVCKDHEEPCNLYCKRCSSIICAHCAVTTHLNHNSCALREELDRSEAELASCLSDADAAVHKLKTALSDLDMHVHLINERKEFLRREIKATMQSFYEALREREMTLLDKLEVVGAHKMRSLQEEKNQVLSRLQPLQASFEKVTAAMNNSSRENLLLERPSLLSAIEQNIKASRQELSIITKPVIRFVCTVESMQEMIGDFGCVQSPGFPDLARCKAEGEGLTSAGAGVLSTFEVVICDLNNEPCEEISLNSIGFCVVSNIYGAVKSGTILNSGPGQYVMGYVPPTRGAFTLNVTVEGKHISDSPFTVDVDCPVENLGSVLHTITDLHSPCGLSFTSNGDIVVAENGGQFISILTSTGERIRSFEALGDAECNNSCGLAVDKEDNILVVDTVNHCVRLFSTSGKLLNLAGTIGCDKLEFLFPQDAAFSVADNRFYIVDQNNRVQVLKSGLTFVKMFGRHGNGNCQLSSPHGIGCDKQGSLYVADTENHRVVTFSPQGRMLKKFVKSELFCPISVAVDNEGHVYVGEIGNKVTIFSPEGSVLTCFDLQGDKSLLKFEVSFPLSVHSNGILYVCDTENNKVLLI